MLWLKNHWIALSSVFLAAMYFYFQLRQWQRHGDDFMFLAVNVIVTFVLCVILIAAISRYVKLAKDLPTRNESDISRIEKAGMLRSHAGQADWLARRLEEIWHAFNDAHKTLTYPLGLGVIPDEVKEWLDKQLWAFRVQYQSHIGSVKAVDPEFHTTLIDDGFPCDSQDYLTVKRKIEAHASSLRKRVDHL